MTDAELLEAYRVNRDREHLDSLFARHYPAVFHTVLRLVRNRTDASDVTQCAFLKAVESAEDLKSNSSLRSWLLTIAVNEVRQFRRSAVRRKLHERELSCEEYSEPRHDADLLRREFEEQLERTLEQIQDDLRDPFVLRYYENLSYAEAASVLGISKSTVQFRIDQALERIRNDFRKRGSLLLWAQFLPGNRLARHVSWTGSLLSAKMLACSALLLCSLVVGGHLLWRASQPGRAGTAASSSTQGAVPRKDRGIAQDAIAPASDLDGPGIFGRVLDRDTQAPIAGVRVSSLDLENEMTDQSESDANGAFRLASAQGSMETYHLRVSGKNYAPLAIESISASSKPVIIEMSGGGAITGRVENPNGTVLFPYRVTAIRRQHEAGKVVQKYRYLYQLALPREWTVEETETVYLSDGRFEIRHLMPGPYVLAVTAADAYPFFSPAESHPSDRWQIEVQEGRTQDIRIVRPNSGTVQVRVVDQEGRVPVAGATVEALAWIDGYRLHLDDRHWTTDERGICDVPASLSRLGTLDSTVLRIAKNGFAPTQRSFSGQNYGYLCEVVLAKPARIRGHVRTREGRPLARAAVYVQREQDGVVATLAFTDEAGSFVSEGLDAPYKYNLYLFDRRLTNLRSVASVLLRVGENREVDFGTSSQASLTGRVTRRGAPCARAALSLGGPGEYDGVNSLTNDKGEFQFEALAPGNYELQVSVADGSQESFSMSRRLALREGERKEMNLDSGGRMIRGTVVDAATLQPLSGKDSVEIIARQIDGNGESDSVTTHSLENGRFALEVARPGLYRLTTGEDSGFSIGTSPLVDLNANPSAEDILVPVYPDAQDGSIRIHVVDAATGAPIPQGWYRYTAGTVSGAGIFEGATIAEIQAARRSYLYQVGSLEHVPVNVTLDLTSERLGEAKVLLVKADAVKVDHVLPSSAAEDAGVREGDIVISYNGDAVRNVGVLKALTTLFSPGQKVTLELRRGPEPRMVIVPGGELGIEGVNASLGERTRSR